MDRQSERECERTRPKSSLCSAFTVHPCVLINCYQFSQIDKAIGFVAFKYPCWLSLLNVFLVFVFFFWLSSLSVSLSLRVCVSDKHFIHWNITAQRRMLSPLWRCYTVNVQNKSRNKTQIFTLKCLSDCDTTMFSTIVSSAHENLPRNLNVLLCFALQINAVPEKVEKCGKTEVDQRKLIYSMCYQQQLLEYLATKQSNKKKAIIDAKVHRIWKLK